MTRLRPRSTLFPYTTLFRSQEMFAAAENLEFEKAARLRDDLRKLQGGISDAGEAPPPRRISERPSARAKPRRASSRPDRKSTRLNSSHLGISYAVFCLKKKN